MILKEKKNYRNNTDLCIEVFNFSKPEKNPNPPLRKT